MASTVCFYVQYNSIDKEVYLTELQAKSKIFYQLYALIVIQNIMVSSKNFLREK